MTAPKHGPTRPTFYRFELGAFEVTSVLEGWVIREPVSPPYGAGAPAAELQALAAANNLPWQNFEHTFAPTLVNTGSQLVLFDTGFGTGGGGPTAGRLLQHMKAAGYAAEDVDIVVLTHCHPDHIAGIRNGDSLAFPNARYAMGQVEYDAWMSGDRIPPQRKENRELFLKLIPPLADRMTFLQPDQEVVPGIRAVAAHGHSLGHMAFRIDSEGKSVLIWGDVANHYVFSLQRPDWIVGFDDDKEQGIATRKRILDMVATDRTMVVGFHMPFPGVGWVEKSGDTYRWVPHTYQLSL